MAAEFNKYPKDLLCLAQVQRRFRGERFILTIRLAKCSSPWQVRLTPESAAATLCRVICSSSEVVFRLDGVYVRRPLQADVAAGKNFTSEVSAPGFPSTTSTVLINGPLAYLASYPLHCRHCGNRLAEPKRNYIVELEDAQEVMDTAMGCCRCHSSADHTCGHIAVTDAGKLLLDGLVPLVPPNYLSSTAVKQEKHIVTCSKCNRVIGRQRITGFIEIEPLLADFFMDNNASGCVIVPGITSTSGYLAKRIIPPECNTYAAICNYLGERQLLIGFYSIQKLWFVGDSETISTNVLVCMFTEGKNIMHNLGSKIYMAPQAISKLVEVLEASHRVIKSCNAGMGIWKVAFLPLLR